MFLLAAVLDLLNIEENNRIEERQQVVLWREGREKTSDISTVKASAE